MKNQLTSISLVRKYVHHIRNIKSLDKEMMDNITTMTNEEKIDIIKSFK